MSWARCRFSSRASRSITSSSVAAHDRGDRSTARRAAGRAPPPLPHDQLVAIRTEPAARRSAAAGRPRAPSARARPSRPRRRPARGWRGFGVIDVERELGEAGTATSTSGSAGADAPDAAAGTSGRAHRGAPRRRPRSGDRRTVAALRDQDVDRRRRTVAVARLLGRRSGSAPPGRGPGLAFCSLIASPPASVGRRGDACGPPRARPSPARPPGRTERPSTRDRRSSPSARSSAPRRCAPSAGCVVRSTVVAKCVRTSSATCAASRVRASYIVSSTVETCSPGLRCALTISMLLQQLADPLQGVVLALDRDEHLAARPPTR